MNKEKDINLHKFILNSNFEFNYPFFQISTQSHLRSHTKPPHECTVCMLAGCVYSFAQTDTHKEFKFKLTLNQMDHYGKYGKHTSLLRWLAGWLAGCMLIICDCMCDCVCVCLFLDEYEHVCVVVCELGSIYACLLACLQHTHTHIPTYYIVISMSAVCYDPIHNIKSCICIHLFKRLMIFMEEQSDGSTIYIALKLIRYPSK